MIELVQAEFEHIEKIAKNARQADIDEFYSLSLSTPSDIMSISLRLSERSWTAIANGCPIAMFGVTRKGMLSNVGIPWLISTNYVDDNQKEFIVKCKNNFHLLANGFSKLENYVDSNNVKAIRWLKWLGFTICEPKSIGVAGEKFHYFYMNKD